MGSKEQQVTELINNVESRHEAIINELSELPPSSNAIDDLLPENNDTWKGLIYETGKEMDQNDAEPLRKELVLRTKDLDKAVNVVNGDEPNTALNDVIGGIQQRTEEMKRASLLNPEKSKLQQQQYRDQEEWLAIMSKLQKANDELTNQVQDARAEAKAAKEAAAKVNNKEPQQDYRPVAIAHKAVIDNLLQEMDNRRQDLNNLKNLNATSGGDGSAVTLAENLRSDAIKRHKTQGHKGPLRESKEERTRTQEGRKRQRRINQVFETPVKECWERKESGRRREDHQAVKERDCESQETLKISTKRP